MSSQSAAPEGSLRTFWWAMAAAALGLVLMYQSVSDAPAQPTHPVAVGGATPAAAPGKAPVQPRGPVLPRSKPVKLHIPQLFVEAPFTELGLNPAGALEAPPANDRNLVGWYRNGPTPGEQGSAVVAGHVDTTTGPAVFLMLHVLLPGSTVEITRQDGVVAVFVVDKVQSYAKNAFPDREVYADTPDAQLRLITCDGAYDRKARDYLDNLVVFAHLQSSRKA